MDVQGNEHITRTFPDGREVHTINGVEQGTLLDTDQRFIPPPPADVQGEGYPPPPLITSPHPPPGHHHSRGFDGPYNSCE